eukprot:12323167-Alexandrium_andersonii.AAC.1
MQPMLGGAQRRIRIGADVGSGHSALGAHTQSFQTQHARRGDCGVTTQAGIRQTVALFLVLAC